MADKMYVTITLRKEVADEDAAENIYEIIKQKMAEYPDVILTGKYNKHFSDE